MGNNNFSISGDDVGRGNSLTTHFHSSTVESEHGFPIQSVDLSRSGVSHNSTLSLPNVDDNVLPDNDVSILLQSEMNLTGTENGLWCPSQYNLVFVTETKGVTNVEYSFMLI